MPRARVCISDWSIKALFIALLTLQVLDLHSTISAPPHRTEANPVIAWIASHVGISVAMLFIKSLSVLVIALMARHWARMVPSQNTTYLLVLLALNFEYLVVVLNNYIS